MLMTTTNLNNNDHNNNDEHDHDADDDDELSHSHHSNHSNHSIVINESSMHVSAMVFKVGGWLWSKMMKMMLPYPVSSLA